MHTQNLDISRRQLLVGGTAAAIGVTAGVMLPAAAGAALPAPTPTGDDIGYLAFAAVAEGVVTAYFTQALTINGAWSESERRLLTQAHKIHRANVDRANAALAAGDKITLGQFARKISVRNRAGALRVGRRLETLLVGTYLGGLAAAGDYGTRLLLGRLLSVATSNGTLLARWAGAPIGGLPTPIDIDAAGPQLDSYLEDPS